MKLSASIILPANDHSQVEEQKNHLNHYFEDFQHIPIYGAKSFFDAWSQGVEQADHSTLIFTHQDVLISSIPHDLNEHLEQAGLVGVAGSRELTRSEPWWFSLSRLREVKLSGAAGHIHQGKTAIASYGPFQNVVALDGVFLATTKEKFADISLPDLGGCYWDFYDHIVSLEFGYAHHAVRTIPVHLFHKSTGAVRRPTFQGDAEKFVARYLSSIQRIETSS